MATASAAVRKAPTKPNPVAANGVLKTFCVGPAHTVRIPPWVTDLASFRRWAHSSDYPDKVRICFLNGEVWVDLSMEEFFSHNQLKNEYAFVLTGLSKKKKPGRFVPDGMLITNVDADLACEPDGMFVSSESFSSGRVRIVKTKKGKQIELEGTPDMALEIVSASSEAKDYRKLRHLFWKAGIPEYWLVDARGEQIIFDILRYAAEGYVTNPKKRGWVKSEVFGMAFRLVRGTDQNGHPDFTLECR